MKTILNYTTGILLTTTMYAQHSGNINYQSKYVAPQTTFDVRFTTNNELIIDIKGLSNIKADTYVAFFNVSQSGSTTEETNSLIDERIDQVRKAVKEKNPTSTFFEDMVSFVPVYEYEVEKKLFSKKTYNEIPAGFEIKKNLHIQYDDPGFLDELITICSGHEIYDLIRVEYICKNIEQKKKELAEKAGLLVLEKLKHYQKLLGTDLTALHKEIVDGFNVFYPVEKYDSYQAYSSSSLKLKRSANVNQADKFKTLYYNPVTNKEFDFVIEPVITEPVIQILYNVKLKVHLKPPTPEKQVKEYVMVTQTGDLKTLQLGN